MSDKHGAPAVPAHLDGVAELAAFVALWRRVLEREAADGLTPLAAPCTMLAVTDDGLRMMTPADVADPFWQDDQLQRTVLRRHVLTEPVRPDDARFAAGGRATSLDGGEVQLARIDGAPAFAGADSAPAAGRAVGDVAGDVVVYAVETPFVSCSEVSDAIGRHPQENPFTPPREPTPPVQL